jgi:hypothetical protein
MRRGRGGAAPPSTDAADVVRVADSLVQLEALLQRIGNPRATEVAALRERFASDPAQAWREIDSNTWWAGAGSLAADTMADNPGLPAHAWEDEVRGFRALLIDIAEVLRSRGLANPGLSSWLLAFRNWNA